MPEATSNVFNPAQKVAVLGLIKALCAADGLMAAPAFDAVVASHTNADGTFNWTGLIAFFNALVAALPAIAQILQMFGL